MLPVCSAVNSVLAIGGVGGLAIGLAGREILENLFTGLIILSSSPFEVGEEVLFTPPSGPVRQHTLQQPSGADAACAARLSCCLLAEANMQGNLVGARGVGFIKIQSNLGSAQYICAVIKVYFGSSLQW